MVNMWEMRRVVAEYKSRGTIQYRSASLNQLKVEFFYPYLRLESSGLPFAD